MAPPSPLAIATGSVQRLVKEEASYHKELTSQEARLEKLLASTEEDENREYSLKQERAAIAETKAVFPPLRQRIADALAKLEDQLESAQGSGASEEEIAKATEAVKQAKAVGA
ncbi:putative tubulin-specific chaperone Rbl2 [Coleophoma crateriformis]|uniref:Tubulin-specific chaperone A n=1 Tax=Coleophoma crateriformis TaxID=565419 RepID=A0A3D8RV82_9HELO|nr:putative tubulin-specific chaperone Rbl2 [Coleophoma crateriformis]